MTKKISPKKDSRTPELKRLFEKIRKKKENAAAKNYNMEKRNDLNRTESKEGVVGQKTQIEKIDPKKIEKSRSIGGWPKGKEYNRKIRAEN